MFPCKLSCEGNIIRTRRAVQLRMANSQNKFLDIDSYLSEIGPHLPKYKVGNPESAVDSVTSCLIAATQKSAPAKTVRLKGPKQRMSRKILGCLQKVKDTYRVWAAAGKPRYRTFIHGKQIGKKST